VPIQTNQHDQEGGNELLVHNPIYAGVHSKGSSLFLIAS
jgi:hypothetical protein